jgi:K+-sensing histidine kinase KdpD
LGLAIVQAVVSDHHGTISVTSDEGRGTSFKIELPQRQAGQRPNPTPNVTADAKTSPKTLAAASD